ncbi:MAG: GNAT family N-acetyltransferase [Flavobacteriales bacterium]|nr:GNAT family N-acetyltransferase [Flavobacteriales bacterium]
MSGQSKYLFTSERLGFRSWLLSDLDWLAEMNANAQVMRYFPRIQSREESAGFIQRMRDMNEERNYCYWPVELLDSGESVGFVGLAYQTYEAHFNPSTDIGWRLMPGYWGKGLASEAAASCLSYAFNNLSIKEIVSVAPRSNIPSLAVMRKIGMKREGSFQHPALSLYPELVDCEVYRIRKEEFDHGRP